MNKSGILSLDDDFKLWSQHSKLKSSKFLFTIANLVLLETNEKRGKWNVEPTGGRGASPVREAYCAETSLAEGPSMTKTSIMPLSDIQ